MFPERCVRSQPSAIGKLPNRHMIGIRDAAVCSKALHRLRFRDWVLISMSLIGSK